MSAAFHIVEEALLTRENLYAYCAQGFRTSSQLGWEDINVNLTYCHHEIELPR